MGLGFGLYDDVWPVYAANIVIEVGGFRVRVRVGVWLEVGVRVRVRTL